MPYDAFISYRHADAEAARAVAKLLRAFEQSVFIDDSIAVGAEWAPEIWSALSASKKLIVLWSRSAAKSEFVHSEWSRAPAACKVFALQLDGEALPATLGKFNAITGLDVAGRLLARSVELMRSQKLSPTKAQEQLLSELAQDGIVLEEKQKRALAAFLPVIAGKSVWLSGSLPAVSLVSGGLLVAFGVGYLLAPKTVQVEFNPACPAASTPATAATASSALPCASSSSAAPESEANGKDARLLQHCQADLAGCRQTVATDTATEGALRGQLLECPAPVASTPLQIRNSKVVLKPIMQRAATQLAAGAAGAAPVLLH